MLNKSTKHGQQSDLKERVKMWKAGKHWVFGTIFFLGMGASLLVTGKGVAADTEPAASDHAAVTAQTQANDAHLQDETYQLKRDDGGNSAQSQPQLTQETISKNENNHAAPQPSDLSEQKQGNLPQETPTKSAVDEQPTDSADAGTRTTPTAPPDDTVKGEKPADTEQLDNAGGQDNPTEDKPTVAKQTPADAQEGTTEDTPETEVQTDTGSATDEDTLPAGFSVSDPTRPDGVYSEATTSDKYTYFQISGSSTTLSFSTDRATATKTYVSVVTRNADGSWTAGPAQEIDTGTSATIGGITIHNDDDSVYVSAGDLHSIYDVYQYKTPSASTDIRSGYAAFKPFIQTQTTKYVDQNGNELAGITPVTMSGLSGQQYTTSPSAEVTGYTPQASENATGTMSPWTANGQQLSQTLWNGATKRGTITYTVKDVNKGTIDYAYQPVNGPKQSGTLEDPSSSASITFGGGNTYNINNPYIPQTTTITYTYDAANIPITIKYVDQFGNTIQPDGTATGSFQTPTTITQPTINHYTYDTDYVPAPGSTTDNVTTFTPTTLDGKANTVTLHYKGNPYVLTVKHVDQDGNPLSTDTIINNVVYGQSLTVNGNNDAGWTVAGYAGPQATQATMDGANDAKTITLSYQKLGSYTIETPAGQTLPDGIEATTQFAVDYGNGTTDPVKVTAPAGFTIPHYDGYIAVAVDTDANQILSLTAVDGGFTAPDPNQLAKLSDSVTIKYYSQNVVITPNPKGADEVTPGKSGDSINPADPYDPRVYPDNSNDADLKKTTTFTVHYVNGGADLNIPANYTRTLTVTYADDGSVQKTKLGAWQYAGDPATLTVTTPDIVDKIPDKTSVTFDGSATDTDPQPQQQVVTYYANTVTVVPGTPGEGEVGPGTQGEVTAPGSPLKFPAGVTADDLQQNVHYTVTYVNGDDTTPNQTRTATYSRTAVVNFAADGTGKVDHYTDWTADVSDVNQPIDTPELAGKVADKPVVTFAAPTSSQDLPQSLAVTVTYFDAGAVTVVPGTPGPGEVVPGKVGDSTTPNSPLKYPDGVTKGDLQQDVAYTVTYVNGDNTTPDQTKTVTYTRTAVINFGKDGTGVLDHYTDWTADVTDVNQPIGTPELSGKVADKTVVNFDAPANSKELPQAKPVTVTYFDAGTVTVVPGTPGPGEVGPGNAGDPTAPDSPLKYPDGVTKGDLQQDVSYTVTYVNGDSTTPDQTKTVTYTRTAVINFGTDGTGSLDHYTDWTADVTGVNQPIDTPELAGKVADKPVVIFAAPKSSQELPQAAPVTVTYFDAGAVTVVPGKPGPGEVGPGKVGDSTTPNSPLKYPDGVTKGDLQQDVAYTVMYVNGDSTTPDQTRSVTYTRTAVINFAKDGTGSLDHYTDWTADVTDVNQPIDTPEIADKVADKTTVTLNAPANSIELPQAKPVIVTYFDAGAVTVVPGTPGPGEVGPGKVGDSTTPNSPLKYPDGVTKGDLQQDVDYTVHYVNGDNTTPDQTKTVTYTRTAVINFAKDGTGSLDHYTDWTADVSDVNQPIDTPELSGKVADKTVVTFNAPTSSEKLPQAKLVTVTYFEAGAVTVVPGTPGPGEVGPGNAGDPTAPDSPLKYPDGVMKGDLQQDVDYTVHYVNGDNTTPDQTKTVTYTRTAVVHFAPDGIGSVDHYTDWTADVTDVNSPIETPVLPGKVANSSNVTFEAPSASHDLPKGEAATVTYYANSVTVVPGTPGPGEVGPGKAGDPTAPDSPLKYPDKVTEADLKQDVDYTVHYVNGDSTTPDQTKTVTYTRNAIVSFDANGNGTVDHYTDWTADVTDVNKPIPTPTLAGKVADKTNVNFGAQASLQELPKDDTVTVTVTYYANQVTVVPGTPGPGEVGPGTAGDPTAPNSPLKYPDKVTEADLQQDVDYTVHYVNGDTTTPDQTKTVTYTRDAIVNFDANGVGTVDHYTDWTADVTDVNKTIATPPLTGKVADKQGVNFGAPASNKTLPKSATITVTYYANSITVVPGTPGPGEVGPGNAGDLTAPNSPLKYPDGVTANDLQQDVAYTVNYVNGDSSSPTNTQQVTYTRTATIHYNTDGSVAGQPEYSDWSADLDDFNADVATPTIPGKVPDQTSAHLDAPTDSKTLPTGAQITVTYLTKAETNDPDGGTTTMLMTPDGTVTTIDKDWPDGDHSHVTINTDTDVATFTETPNGGTASVPKDIQPGETGTTGRTTVSNLTPSQNVQLTHDGITETVTPDGKMTITQVPAGLSVTPEDYYQTTTTNDPDGGVTTVTTNGNHKVTTIDKTWPDGDESYVVIDVDTGIAYFTETPKGGPTSTPHTVKPGDADTINRTTVINHYPDGGIELQHRVPAGTVDDHGNTVPGGSITETVRPNGTRSFSMMPDPVFVTQDDFYITEPHTGGGEPGTTGHDNPGSNLPVPDDIPEQTPTSPQAPDLSVDQPEINLPNTVGQESGHFASNPNRFNLREPAGQGVIRSAGSMHGLNRDDIQLANTELAKRNNLPQTGERQHTGLIALGLAMLAGMLGLAGRRHKHDEA
ncbi:KxYKxGKxW signal peptide domain-containing protein [Lacticaseibacillus pabuli]|uniref:KxYKxGKxW signal peptide domain-containing protein n=1 Tax=Lacticaseibacillus pabuli TaxID=3025672 RepID=A0ABY7WW39_9LACO|nr:MucBP domain-containing protein [Lacticaseibacillus sp. KACC 23028]WDF83723.1 KxYKxGKxW signal peptide domain-containing protein [Lacticaseibacillus sp. KACC 23028]